MKFSKSISAIVATFVFTLTAYPAVAKQENKGKAKNSEKHITKENSGRDAGELPSGLQKYSERKGQLPSGLQKKKDEGQLTKGLEKGGKKLKTTTTN
jgi:hypothetical protein